MKHIPYFNDFLTDKVNLNQSRINKLNQKVETITNLLKSDLDSYRKYSMQGSYAHRTIIKPVKDNDEFDADILVFIKDDNFSPSGFTDHVKEVHTILKSDGNYKDIVKLNSRCITIDYAGDFHLDIVPCIEDNDKHYICNRKDQKHEQTDGDGYKEWLVGKNKVVGGNNFIKVTRLLKFLRDHKGNFSAKSILLTTLLGNQVNSYSDYSDLPTTLKLLSNSINDYLQQNSAMPTIQNPILPGEDFNRHWDETKYSNFKEKFAIYNTKINDAFSEADHNKSVKKWRELFGDDFGKLKNNSAAAAAAAGAGTGVVSGGVAATRPFAGDDFI